MKPQITTQLAWEAWQAAMLQRSCGMKPQITGDIAQYTAEIALLQRSCGMKPQITALITRRANPVNLGFKGAAA